jgi:hypothetical protein
MSSTHSLPTPLFWLEDAPLFADSAFIERFYDAVASPENREKSIGLEITENTVASLRGKLNLEASLTTEKLAPLLAPLFAFIKPTLKAAAEGEGSSQSTEGLKHTIQMEPISTPQRQLKQLALYYLVNYSDRIFFVDNPSATDWRNQSVISAVPRAVVFISLPGAAEAAERGLPQTKLIPTAAEFEKGAIVQLYRELQFTDGDMPEYPEKGSEAELVAKRRDYWAWFDEHYSATKAMVAIEKAASEHGRIRWIDYRLPISKEGDTLHLHVCPAGQYDSGILAYNFVKRGFKHGIRLVGTLKSEPDVNVLAVYDR